MSENDRQLMINTFTDGGSLNRFGFMSLPEELQDEILDGLDKKQMSLAAAEVRIKDAGYSLSGESVRRYYRALIAARKSSDVRLAILRTQAAFGDMGLDKIYETMCAFMCAVIVGGIEDGSLQVPPKDLLKFLGAMPTAFQKGIGAFGSNESDKPPIDVTSAQRKKIKDIYGI